MNALEDTRELVHTFRATAGHQTPTDCFVAGLVEDLLYLYPDVELATIRITEEEAPIAGVRVTGRRGRLAAECPSCHTTDGHPHTPYCRASEQQRGHHLVHSEAFIDQDDPRSAQNREDPSQPGAHEALCGFRSLDNINLVCSYPPHPVSQLHSWQDGGDPRGWRNAIDPNKP